MSQETGRVTPVEPIPSAESESTDQIFRSLADPRRRVAVAYLAEVDRPVSRDELVQHVAATVVENGFVDGTERDRVCAQFYHHHFPKLADAGLILYDEEEGVVHATEATHCVSEWLTGC